MTNKLPVAGKRYRHKKDSFVIKVKLFQLCRNGYFVFPEEKLSGWSWQEFLEQFEELPDSNSQKPQELKVNEIPNPIDLEKEEVSEKDHEEFARFSLPRRLKAILGSLYSITPADDFSAKEWEFAKTGLIMVIKEVEKVKKEAGVSEVERALEELKRALHDTPYSDSLYPGDVISSRNRLKKVTENLVNALEAEKSLCHKNDQKLDTKEFDSLGLDTKQDMSKPEPKTDIKEEHVEPVSIEKESIWSCFSDDFIYNSGFTPEQILVFEVIINSFEQMQKDIQELKKQGK